MSNKLVWGNPETRVEGSMESEMPAKNVTTNIFLISFYQWEDHFQDFFPIFPGLIGSVVSYIVAVMSNKHPGAKIYNIVFPGI